jgi:transposase
VLGIPIALRSVSNLEEEVADALGPAYQEAGELVRAAPAKNLDETGWRGKDGKCWLWLAATARVAALAVHGSVPRS